MTLMDRVMNKITGGNMETVRVTREQFTAILEREFTAKAESEDDLRAIVKTVRGGLFLRRSLLSKDGEFQLYCCTRITGFFNRNLIWIHDIRQNKFYEYRAFSFRKLKKAVAMSVEAARQRRLPAAGSSLPGENSPG